MYITEKQKKELIKGLLIKKITKGYNEDKYDYGFSDRVLNKKLR